MTQVTTECYCDDMIYRKCAYCQDAADLEEEREVCASWSWNCTPRECASEAKERGWGRRRLESAMKSFGYSRENIEEVLFEFEVDE